MYQVVNTPPPHSGQKKRVEFFDLAKGFCIFLVVLYHVSQCYEIELPAKNIIKQIRLPLYFFLSGCFFKTYEGFGGFLIRKLNKLFLPFVFWFCFSLGISFLLFSLFNLKLFPYYDLNIHSIYINTKYGTYPNSPIWFLLCLFWVNIMFYMIDLFSDKLTTKYRPYAIGFLSFMMGIVGVTFSNYGIRLPFYIDSAFTAVPFFAFGYFSFRFTPLARKSKLDKWIPLVIVLFIVILYFVAPFYSLRKNTSIGYQSFWLVYLCGFMGTLVIILLSKMIQKLPIVSLWGRYSIMILVSHAIVYRLLSILVFNSEIIGMSTTMLFVLNLIVTMSICTLLIPFMKKFMPHVTAQRDIIPIREKMNKNE